MAGWAQHRVGPPVSSLAGGIGLGSRAAPLPAGRGRTLFGHTPGTSGKAAKAAISRWRPTRSLSSGKEMASP